MNPEQLNISFDKLALTLKARELKTNLDKVTIHKNIIHIQQTPKNHNPFKAIGTIVLVKSSNNNFSINIRPYNNFKIVLYIGLALMVIWTLFGFLISSDYNSILIILTGWTIASISLAILYYSTKARLYSLIKNIVEKDINK